ncbi:hypothetical protein ACFVVC_02230 [Pseudarthrobacter sp. NPDC058196]|uniref:hypothetical protein n=1 Tax=Pseudarthrobacter sp. NPDC058196 TaxID=3346376 RepID=UPI0036D9684A
MARGVFILCACCAFKLTNDDESACRDYHGHDHAGLQVPAGTAVTQGPHEWDGSLELRCHGHEGGMIQPLEEYWVARPGPVPAEAGVR